MIPILLQEAECWDKFTILEVKIFHCDDKIKKEKMEKELKELQYQMDKCIGFEKNKEIYCSNEYTELYNVNFELFEMVDLAKEDKIKASDVDKLVYERYLAKKKLQEKYFGNELQEQKIGYKEG